MTSLSWEWSTVPDICPSSLLPPGRGSSSGPTVRRHPPRTVVWLADAPIGESAVGAAPGGDSWLTSSVWDKG